MSRAYKEINGNERVGYKAISRWIKIDYTIISPKHRLAKYADNPGNDNLWLNYFRHGRKWYAMGQFMRLYQPIELENGVQLIGYDVEGGLEPVIMEMNNAGTAVRLWRTMEVK